MPPPSVESAPRMEVIPSEKIQETMDKTLGVFSEKFQNFSSGSSNTIEKLRGFAGDKSILEKANEIAKSEKAQDVMSTLEIGTNRLAVFLSVGSAILLEGTNPAISSAAEKGFGIGLTVLGLSYILKKFQTRDMREAEQEMTNKGIDEEFIIRKSN